MQMTEPVAELAPGVQAPKPQTLAQCHEVIDILVQRAAELQGEVAWLHERVTLNSKTSSKPASSDGPGSPNRAQRAVPAYASAARKKVTRAVTQVDQIVDCPAPEVCECGASVTPEGEPVRHQVFEISVVRAQVSEYRLHGGCCTACGKARRAPLPAGVPRGQLGPQALALIGVLGTCYHLTQGKVRDLLAQVLGLDLSVGTVSQAHDKMALALALALAAPMLEAANTLSQVSVLPHGKSIRHAQRLGPALDAVDPGDALYRLQGHRALVVLDEVIELSSCVGQATGRLALMELDHARVAREFVSHQCGVVQELDRVLAPRPRQKS